MPKKINTNQQDKFSQLGFSDYGVPSVQEPKMPTKLSELTFEKVADYMSVFQAWKQYCASQYAKALVDYLKKQDEYDYEYDKIVLGSNKNQVAARKAEASISPQLRKMRSECLNADMLQRMLSLRIESYTDCISTISREITRRSNGYGQNQ